MYQFDKEIADRPDMELAKDRDWMRIRENVYRDQNKDVPKQPFAQSETGGKKVSEVVENLVLQGGGQASYYNHQLFWDMDLNDAREWCAVTLITPIGWDAPITELEQIDVTGNNKGHEYEIFVELYASCDECS